MNEMDNNDVDIHATFAQFTQMKQDNELLKQDIKQLKRDIEQVTQQNEQFKRDNEQVKRDIEQLQQDNEQLQLKVAQLEAITHSNDGYCNNNDNTTMSVYQRPHVQKRQKVSQDADRKEEDDNDGAYGGIPSHLLELICRLVIRSLAKHLPARHEELVALSAATGLCNDDDVARLRDSVGCRRELLTIIDTDDPLHIEHASYNMAGTQILSVTDTDVSIWDAKTGELIRCFEEFESDINHASFNPRGDLIVTACENGTARIWSVRTGECVRVLDGHTDIVLRASYSHDGEWIATASFDGTVRVWNASTGECVRVLRHNDETKFESALYSPDDSMIVTVQRDKEDGKWIHTASIWDAVTGECRRMLKGHTDDVTSASFSPDGSLVVTASWDKTARIWRVETGECIHILQGHENDVASAMFSPDGAHIVTSSWDGTVRIWDVADGRQLFLYDKPGSCYCIAFACYDPKGTRILARGGGGNGLCILSAPVFRFK